MPIKVGLKKIEKWGSNLELKVQSYEKEQNEKGQIVFYGPSFFTRWDGRDGSPTMRESLLGASGKQCVINRGFGTSSAEHQLYYYPRMVRPLEPKVLVYEGEANGTGLGYTLDEIWELAQRVITYALTDFPDIQIYLPGVHPTRYLTPEAYYKRDKYDAFLREFADTHKNCHYVNVLGYKPFTDPEIRDRIFIADNQHFNPEGYAIYADFWREVLKDELAKY